jgi:D-alanyl-D-alanine carboxypeptidase
MTRVSTMFVAAIFVAAGCGGSLATASSASAPVRTTTVPTSAPTVAKSTFPGPTPSPTSNLTSLLGALPAGPLDASVAARLQSTVDRLVADGAPDAIAAVITRDGVWSGAAGIDGPAGRRAKAGDEFAIASISKIVLAALVLRLAQDGRMSLDAPLSSYLGDLPVDANRATVRDALGMRSGIGATPSEFVDAATADCARIWTRAEVLRSIPAPHASAGTSVEYSNPTYKLLAYAVETATGTPLATAFHDIVFAPAGVTRILQQVPTKPTLKPWALPIAGHEGDIDLAAYGTGGTLPCNSLNTFSFHNALASDAPSLARWGWALFSGALLDRASLEAMTTMEPGAHPGDPDSWGLGIERLPEFGGLAYGTRGSQTGYNSFLVIMPERQAVAVMFINDGKADVEAGASRLIAALAP